MKLLLTGAFNYSQQQKAALKNSGFEITFVQNELEKLSIDCSRFDAVVCNGLFLHNNVEDFKNLKAVQLTSAGYDRVPVSLFAQKGIALFNAKGVYNIPMAEWAVLKTLEIYKSSHFFFKKQEASKWEKNRNLRELYGKSVLIIGVGNIGQECAKRFKAFGTKVLGADIFDSKSPFVDEFFYMDSLNTALRLSDVVVLCLPFTEKTHHLINSETLAHFKDDAVLINISRGKVINEIDLLKALHDGKLSGVALDVFEEEPLSSENPLWQAERVLITPHNSFVSDAVNDRLFALIHKNLTEFDYGKN
ncbi:MAG: hydroxyacid dehydrogenase [Clostridia bacterium]|nr:hydroxyacid dehydrogenase [Clostridia bacterium]